MTAPSPFSSRDTALPVFRRMLLMRHFEERSVELTLAEAFPGTNAVYVGQEATGVALGTALNRDDPVFTTHRNHGHVLARGGDPKRIMAELFGKATGYCKGKGGSFHVSAKEVGVPSASGILAAGMPVATGAALAFKLRCEPQVAVSLLGDRTLAEGAAWEAFNLAALWQAPVIFICENNEAIPYDAARNSMMATERLADLARPFRMAVQEVDGADLKVMHEALSEAAERARKGGGPTFLETLTVRWPTRVAGGKYRIQPGLTRVAETWEAQPEDAFANWRRNEPIGRAARRLLAENLATKAELEAMEREVIAEVDAAVEFARSSPYPEASAAFEDLYA